MSDTSHVFCGVPQGSVFGPVLLCMYTMPLEDIIFHHGLQYVMYADDIELYITCDGNQFPTGTVEGCVGEIRHWMGTNMVALNERKTDVIHFSSKFYGHGPVPSCDHHVGGVSISPSNATCNPGAMTDSTGTMSNHVSTLCKSASFAL